MSMKIAHNMSAINAQKNLYTSQRGLGKSIEKLSSGYRINTGQDAPSDLVISEKLRSQQSGIERAIRNTSESINLLNVAEGALNEMNSILKKMKGLAIHSNNTGIVSPDQVAADQAEMDSGIQTLERIANTTMFSDAHLINGGKDITWTSSVGVTSTQNNRLINENLSSFSMISNHRDPVTISFSGTKSSENAYGDAYMAAQATRAYLEINPIDGTQSQVGPDGKVLQAQSFILTGNKGSAQFNFMKGASAAQIAADINSLSASTGIGASLCFRSDTAINYDATATIFDNFKEDRAGCYVKVVTESTVTVAGAVAGFNTDGLGYIYAKVVSSLDGTKGIEYYKDASLSAESLIGTQATSGGTVTARNDSQLTIGGLTLTADARHGDVVKISAANLVLDSTTACATGMDASNFASTSKVSGVQLGKNTDEVGNIYIKLVNDGNGTIAYAYKGASMQAKDLVAQTHIPCSAAANTKIILDSVWNEDQSFNTGLAIELDLAAAMGANTTQTMTISFQNLGARIYAEDYGEQGFIQVQQITGGLFVNYETPDDYYSEKVVEGTQTLRITGQDAQVNVNGKRLHTNGLEVNAATNNIMADLKFNEGKTGSTTIAQVGYGEGTIFTKCGALTVAKADGGKGVLSDITAFLNQANHTTVETLKDFQGGMILQLGEGGGDQNRTVVGIKSMSTANMGRMEVTAVFDRQSAVLETRMVSIQDLMGGQVADLSSGKPWLTISIIEKAIEDVSFTRASIGAMQANMLQTNENNLRVALENITKTESDIRDTDMSSEMTEFTKNQILTNAGISMVTQGNQMAQAALQLLP